MDALTSAVSTTSSPTTLRDSVEASLSTYFSNLGDKKPENVYDLLMAGIEEPLFKAILNRTRGNQSKAAILLGISRGTLRKKLKRYDLI